MFPVIKFKVRGLQPHRMYSIAVEFVQQGDHRWKYIDGEWAHAGKADQELPSSVYIHPNSPKFGHFWMKDTVDFSKVKITNRKSSSDMVN